METQGRLIVDVARLEAGGEAYCGETGTGLLELGESEWVTPVGGMRYALRVEMAGDELLVRGEVRQSLRCVCSRCAVEFDTEVAVPDFLCSLERDTLDEFVDLTSELREATILALPGYPVCRETCQGLCMTCGVNLNTASCSCREKGRDRRWSVLDALS